MYVDSIIERSSRNQFELCKTQELFFHVRMNSEDYLGCVRWASLECKGLNVKLKKLKGSFLIPVLLESYEINVENARLIQSLVATEGILESPINLDISHMKVIELNVLRWFNIDVPPKKLKITNTGYTAIISAKWQRERPYLSGGPFQGNYVFSQIHFHWGENEMDGSEHTIDGTSMPMELHAVHFKSDYDTLDIALRRDDGIAVLVYFFKLQEKPNQYMEDIVKSLSLIRTTNSSVRLTPASLINITRPFNADYFLYWGSIVTIHNVHKILWLISREPIGISTEQIAEFRTLNDSRELPILSNRRPLKERQRRAVYHACHSGSTYSSLLPIPRGSSPQLSDGIITTVDGTITGN